MPKFALTPVYGDRSVLQRDRQHVFWGSAPDGAEVTIRTENQATSVKSSGGEWTAAFGPLPTGGPYKITITCGAEQIVLSDILVGDVWLICGQSNAARTIKSKFPKYVSVYTGFGPVRPDFYPPDQAKQMLTTRRSWVASGRASAVGLSFATQLQKSLGAPQGIVHCAFAGTAIQTWYSSEGKSTKIGSTAAWARRLPANAMAAEWVRPIDKMPARGVLWWQGESNIPFHADYADHLKQLILEWRSARNDPFMPFVIVQLQDIASEDVNNLSAFRIAQARAANEAGNCIVVPVDDLTMTGDLHPPANELTAIGWRCAELCVLGVVSKVDD